MVTHKSGQRGKKVLDTLKKAQARVLEAPAIKTDRDKTDFAATSSARRPPRDPRRGAGADRGGRQGRARARRRRRQLVADTKGTIDEELVAKYHGGKVEATGFKVADAAVAGNAGEALRLLRHAIATGVDPVPIVAVLAQQLRQLVKVGSAGRGRSADVARDLGMAPWQVDKARRGLSGWGPEGLGEAIQAVAHADFEVKGGGRDPVYAVERAVLTSPGPAPVGDAAVGDVRGDLCGGTFWGSGPLAGRFTRRVRAWSCAHAASSRAPQPQVPHAWSREASAAL